MSDDRIKVGDIIWHDYPHGPDRSTEWKRAVITHMPASVARGHICWIDEYGYAGHDSRMTIEKEEHYRLEMPAPKQEPRRVSEFRHFVERVRLALPGYEKREYKGEV